MKKLIKGIAWWAKKSKKVQFREAILHNMPCPDRGGGGTGGAIAPSFGDLYSKFCEFHFLLFTVAPHEKLASAHPDFKYVFGWLHDYLKD